MEFKTGQVILYRADYRSRLSIAVSLLAKSPWTHTSLVVEGGDINTAWALNTYPATDSVLLPVKKLVEGREYVVLDLTGPDGWRERVRKAAYALIGSEYWFSPCSRVVARAFINAGVPFFKAAIPSLRERLAVIFPHEYLTRTRMAVVAKSH